MDADVEELVGSWLPLPQVAERIGSSPPQVRAMVRSGRLVAARVGDPPQLSVPAAFVHDGELVKKLAGTLRLLRDQGFGDADALRWLFTPDDTLPGTPVQALAENRGTEVRRRAQALGF